MCSPHPIAIFLLTIFCSWSHSAVADQPLFVLREVANSAKKPHSPFPRLAADFEPQRALVLSVSDWQPHHAPVFQQLVKQTQGHVELLVLCNTQAQFFMVMGWLDELPEQSSHLHFALLELDTIWLRDFGPLFAETATNQFQLLDFLYAGERPQDDRLPQVWAERTGAKLVPVSFTLQGGNFLTNGQHLAIATSRIFVDNAITFPYPTPGMDTQYEGRKIVFEAFLESCNLKEFIILEHLQHEATKHVDMFATFVSPHQVVIAAVDPRVDPVNAAILDRNARRLQAIQVEGRPLEVHRLPIPPRQGQSWSAFTNVIFANDLVLMPIYSTDPQPMVDRAIELYQKLLPNHTVKTVDITSFKQLQGELHCLSLNLPKSAPWLPQTTTFADGLAAIKSGKIKPPAPQPTPSVSSQPTLQTNPGDRQPWQSGQPRPGNFRQLPPAYYPANPSGGYYQPQGNWQ